MIRSTGSFSRSFSNRSFRSSDIGILWRREEEREKERNRERRGRGEREREREQGGKREYAVNVHVKLQSVDVDSITYSSGNLILETS